jgi:hypothetical protein
MTQLEKIQNISEDTSVLNDLLSEIESAYYDIPFGNTKFQQENFIFAASITPQRAYRTIGLTIHALLTTLRDQQLAVMEAKIDIDELLHKLQDPAINEFEKRRLDIKYLRLTQDSKWREKLINDAIEELKFYYSKFKSFPQFTREEFEQGEKTYFEQSLRRQLVGLTGTKEALINMTDDMKTMENFEGTIKNLTDETFRQNLLKVAINSLAGPIIFEEDKTK